MQTRALVLISIVASQGCVLGRNPTARHVAMAIDGATMAGGITLAATANHSSSTFAGGVAAGVANTLQSDLGAALIVTGLVSLVINLALAPTEPTPAIRTELGRPTVQLAPGHGLALSALTIEP